jgi:hypothetical protein
MSKENPTWGEKQAGVSFNPGGDPKVDEIKQDFANLMDKINDLRTEAGRGEKARFYSMALSHMNDAQMETVKGITWSHDE